MKLRRTFHLVLAACLVVISGAPALAQEKGEPETVEVSATQRQYNDSGVKAMAAGNNDEAVAFFKSSLALGENNVTYLNLGRALYKLERCREAAVAYDRVEQVPVVEAPSPEDVSRIAEKYRGELDERCSATLELACESDDMKVKIDDHEPFSCEEASVAVVPGSHDVVGTLDGDDVRASVDVGEGQTQTVELKFEEVAELADIPSEDDGGETESAGAETSAEPATGVEIEAEPGSTRRMWGWILMGTGVGLWGVAIAVDRLVIHPDFEEYREDAREGRPEDEELRTKLENRQRLNQGIVGLGALSVATGVILFLWQDDEEDESTESAFAPWVSERAAGVSMQGVW